MDDNNKNNINPQNDGIKVLRTYTSDMADVIRNNEITVAKIAMEEKRKREEEDSYQKAEGTKTSKVLFLLGGLILIILATAGVYFVIKGNRQQDAVTPSSSMENISTFISYDLSSYIDVTNTSTLSGLINLINNNKEANKTIKVFFLTKKSSESINNKVEETSQLITTEDFLNLIGANIPQALIRSLGSNYLLGEYTNTNNTNTNNIPSMFLILQTKDYNQAYVSMLDWEKTMLKDLYNLFNIGVSNTELFEKPWEDIIIDNRDVRVLYDENRMAILYYVFLDKNQFIITTNIDALREVISRLLIKNN